MLKRYSIADARKNLPGLVAEAEAGSEVELTRRGEPVAVLLSTHEYRRIKDRRRVFAQALAEFHQRFDVAEVGVDEDFVDSLRDIEAGREVKL